MAWSLHRHEWSTARRPEELGSYWGVFDDTLTFMCDLR